MDRDFLMANAAVPLGSANPYKDTSTEHQGKKEAVDSSYNSATDADRNALLGGGETAQHSVDECDAPEVHTV